MALYDLCCMFLGGKAFGVWGFGGSGGGGRKRGHAGSSSWCCGRGRVSSEVRETVLWVEIDGAGYKGGVGSNLRGLMVYRGRGMILVLLGTFL